MQRAQNAFAKQLRGQSTYLAKASLPGRLYQIGWFPGAISEPQGTERVWGELYRMHQPAYLLPVLDDYEETADSGSGAGLFVRKVVPVSCAGQTLSCWVYLYNGPTDSIPQIKSGDFNPYL